MAQLPRGPPAGSLSAADCVVVPACRLFSVSQPWLLFATRRHHGSFLMTLQWPLKSQAFSCAASVPHLTEEFPQAPDRSSRCPQMPLGTSALSCALPL